MPYNSLEKNKKIVMLQVLFLTAFTDFFFLLISFSVKATASTTRIITTQAQMDFLNKGWKLLPSPPASSPLAGCTEMHLGALGLRGKLFFWNKDKGCNFLKQLLCSHQEDQVYLWSKWKCMTFNLVFQSFQSQSQFNQGKCILEPDLWSPEEVQSSVEN